MHPDSPPSRPPNAPSPGKSSPSAGKGSPSPEEGSPSSKAEDRDRPAILLLGHGSHINGLSSDSVHELARKLRATGRHPEVRVAFWKEEPQLRHAFLLVESPEVVAVPFFTSEGYFTDRVLPRELRIDPPVSEVGRVVGPGEGRPSEPDDSIRVHYTRAVGAHPAMADAVLERARDRLKAEGLVDSGVASEARTGNEQAAVEEADTEKSIFGKTTLVVLGHGTERHPASGEIVKRLTEDLARTSPFTTVTCCFLDQDPRMLPVLESVETPRAVMVPFFMAEGWHVGQTIPRDLNLEEGRSRVGTTEVFYADPVGTHPAMVDVVEEMVAEAIEGVAIEGAAIEERASSSSSLPSRAREAFLAWIDTAGEEGRTFLETRVRKISPSPRYEIRHAAASLEPADLERSSDPEWARIVAARTDEGEHRPLKTAPDLRRGWLLENLSARDVWEAYAHLYPVAPVHWYLGHEGALPVIPFRETAERQTGIYRIIQELDDGDVEQTRAELCEGRCLRRVRWPLRGRGGIAEGPASESELLCPEACSLFVTVARERAAGGDSNHGHD